MAVGKQLKRLREEKKLSQGDIEEKTGLLRCYVSRVENEHTVPSVQTLEKFASALEVPLYKLFYRGEEPIELLNSSKLKNAYEPAWGCKGKDARLLTQFCHLLGRTSASDRKLLLFVAGKMAKSESVIQTERIQRS